MRKNLQLMCTLLAALFISNMAISQITNAPVIDGDMSEAAWSNAPLNGISSTISDLDVTSTDDLSGKFKVLWSPEYLYVAVNVKDDSLYVGEGDKWNYDNICIYFDAFNKKTATYVDSTQVYYEKNWWQGDTVMGGRVGPNWGGPVGAYATNVVAGTEYTIELAIPFNKYFYFSQVSPAIGDVMGFDIKLSDNDNTGVRDQITYWDITDHGYENPSLFGEIKLLEDGNVELLSFRPAKPTSLSAVIEEGAVKLSWEAPEGITKFTVYRKASLTASYTAIAENIEAENYSDAGLADGTYYYIVRSADAEGVLSNASNQVEVIVSGINDEDALISIYPNPANDVLNVCSEIGKTVEIYNVSGKLLISKQLNSTKEEINISDLTEGYYIVKVGNKAQSLIVK